MSENPTVNIGGDDSFEARILAELRTLNSRLIVLEEKVDARLRETRPIWEAVLTRVELIDGKIDVLARDILTSRAEVDLLKKHLPPAA